MDKIRKPEGMSAPHFYWVVFWCSLRAGISTMIAATPIIWLLDAGLTHLAFIAAVNIFSPSCAKRHVDKMTEKLGKRRQAFRAAHPEAFQASTNE